MSVRKLYINESEKGSIKDLIRAVNKRIGELENEEGFEESLIETPNESTGSIKSLIRAVQNRIDELEDEFNFDESLSEAYDAESDDITPQEAKKILRVFDAEGVDVVNTRYEDELFDGVNYKNFVVETSGMSYTVAGDLETALRNLEDHDDIGFEKNFNTNGEFDRTYYFYHFYG